MNTDNGSALEGGNMNAPRRIGDRVHRRAGPSTATLHRLLAHVRSKGVDWVPVPYGVNDRGEEVLSYIDGEVPHAMPGWVWDAAVLESVAGAQRRWHDATADFDGGDAVWQMPAGDPVEVICHNDFAPYNLVFRDGRVAGLIDFDLCSPGSRLWDMAYTLYRFVPVMPTHGVEPGDEVSPFGVEDVLARIARFNRFYAGGDDRLAYGLDQTLAAIAARLVRISEWTFEFATRTHNPRLLQNARMYQRHSAWVRELR